jgi:hypothetical protein
MTIKLYGGDAVNSGDLCPGDIMTTDLLNEAIKEMLQESYLSQQRINVTLTDTQLMQIKPKREELFAMIYFLPINTYSDDSTIQEAIVSCNNKLIKIYTYIE